MTFVALYGKGSVLVGLPIVPRQHLSFWCEVQYGIPLIFLLLSDIVEAQIVVQTLLLVAREHVKWVQLVNCEILIHKFLSFWNACKYGFVASLHAHIMELMGL